MYHLAKDDLRTYLKKSSHSARLIKLNIEEDVKFCLKLDTCKCIPVLVDERIIQLAVDQ